MIKKNLTAFLFIASVFTAVAQQTSKCEEQIAVFEQTVKAGKYDDALQEFGGLVKKCPNVDEKLYTLAETALVYKIESAQTKELKQQFADSIFGVYQLHNKNFPKAKNGNGINKALIQNDYRLADEKEVFKALDAAFVLQPHDYTDYRAIETYYNIYLKRFEAGQEITLTDFTEKFGAISTQVMYAKNRIADRQNQLKVKEKTEPLTQEEKDFLARANKNIDVLTAVGENVDRQSSKHFSCKGLEEYYTANFEKNKENSDWLEALVNVMFLNRCYESEILAKGAATLYKLKPSAQSAFNMGTIELRKNNIDSAAEYFDKSAQLETDIDQKAEVYYKVAGILRNSDKARAKEYIIKTVKANPKKARAYILLAEMYASVTKECNITDFERKALLWLAIDTVKKAEEADVKYKGTVASMIENYEKRLPNRDEVKEAGKRKGDEIVYGCWINETVTVPKVK
ncbi:hypothetical protein ABS768_06875 [Flavobacterium sp. ST-75]|uniref:Tetratricopeptide repeat protein n=1 Tax=Flavobacterium rhizophilum TaxID=3163296 RepID=A0ABW8YD17_9FLAO